MQNTNVLQKTVAGPQRMPTQEIGGGHALFPLKLHLLNHNAFLTTGNGKRRNRQHGSRFSAFFTQPGMKNFQFLPTNTGNGHRPGV